MTAGFDGASPELGSIAASPPIPDPTTELVLFDEIDGDPQNVRETLPNVKSLKESIRQYGLLENLIGRVLPEDERSAPHRWCGLKAGSRRFEAIRQLVEEGAWPRSRRIPVRFVDTNGFWEQLVENLQREELEPWALGRRLSEAAGEGLTQRDIGLRIGKTTGFVSRYTQIGTGLHPDAIGYIKTQKLKLTIGDLYRVSLIRDRFGDPDSKAQLSALSAPRARRQRSPKHNKDALRAFGNRITYMRSQMPIPPVIQPIVTAVLHYLENGGVVNFKVLAEDILTECNNQVWKKK